ncbi:MAG: tetratricopeptide repeat protein, partial [Thermoguttaceae bacterium]
KTHMPTASVGMAPGMAAGRSHEGPWEREKTHMPTTSVGMAPGHCPLSTVHCPLFYWLSLAAFVLAMLSKGSAVILPVLLLGIAWWLRPKGTDQIFVPTKMGLSPYARRDLVLTAPFFAVAIALTVVNVWFQTHGMDVAYRTVNFAERLLGAGGVIWFYLYKALLPLNLVFVYPQWRVEAGNPLWWLPLAAALAVTAVLWRYRKGWSRPLLFAWGFFCVALVPVLGLKDVGFMEHSLVADHYQHIAIIGLIALVSAGFSAWHRQSRCESHWATAVAVAVVMALAFLTWRQSGLYRDAITLYQATLEKNPKSWIVQNNLGIALDDAGRPQDAINYYREALRLKPDYAEAHYNLGFALVKIGLLPESIKQYEQALRLKSDYSEAHNNLGIVLHKMGRLQESIEQFQLALRSKPDFPEAHNNLGIALVQAGRPEKAVEQYKQAISFKPDYDKAYFNLGNAYKAMGQHQEAIENYRQALELARAHGQTDLARQIENTLNSYKAGPINLQNSPSDSQSPPPPP